jgi:RAB protein geranylgeranyltransferase component A
MKDLLNPWVIAGAVIVASVLIAITFLASGAIIPIDQQTYYGEAALTVIPVPTQTPTVIPPNAVFTPTL